MVETYSAVVSCRVLQLIYECKEVLTAAVTVKQYYIHMVGSVVTADDTDGFVLDIETYEDDLQNMLEVSSLAMLRSCYLLLPLPRRLYF